MPSCAICSIEVPTDKHLRLHIQAKHDDRELTCQQCKKTCKGGKKLSTHMDSHREVNCKHCDQTIPYNSRNSHMIKCVGEKKAFKCENCPAAFNRADKLKVHMTNKSCEVQCNICDKTCKGELYLEKHISQTHRLQMNVLKTAEGHIGLFPTTEVRKDLNCQLEHTQFSLLVHHHHLHKNPLHHNHNHGNQHEPKHFVNFCFLCNNSCHLGHFFDHPVGLLVSLIVHRHLSFG